MPVSKMIRCICLFFLQSTFLARNYLYNQFQIQSEKESESFPQSEISARRMPSSDISHNLVCHKKAPLRNLIVSLFIHLVSLCICHWTELLYVSLPAFWGRPFVNQSAEKNEDKFTFPPVKKSIFTKLEGGLGSLNHR